MKTYEIKDLDVFKACFIDQEAYGHEVKLSYWVECFTEEDDVVYIRLNVIGNGDEYSFYASEFSYDEAFTSTRDEVEILGTDDEFEEFYNDVCNAPQTSYREFIKMFDK